MTVTISKYPDVTHCIVPSVTLNSRVSVGKVTFSEVSTNIPKNDSIAAAAIEAFVCRLTFCSTILIDFLSINDYDENKYCFLGNFCYQSILQLSK